MPLRFADLLLTLLLPAVALAGPAVNSATADALLLQGSYEEARRAYLALHATLERTLGSEHPQTVLALANACDASVPLTARLDSLPLCTRVLALRESVLGPDSPQTARTLSDLALLYAADGHLNKAGKLLERALRIAGPGTGSPDTAGLMNNLAYLYFQKGKYTRSRDMFERAIALVEKGANASDPDLATMLSNLGTAELAAHDAGSAQRHFRSALALSEQSFGADSARNLKPLKGLARAETALGNSQEAAVFHSRAQLISQLSTR